MADTLTVRGISDLSLLISRLFLELAVRKVEDGTCDLEHVFVLFLVES